VSATARTGAAVAMRALALHCVAAVAFGVERDAVVAWMRDQGIWNAASPAERAFLESAGAASDEMNSAFQWRKEAEWALLWAAGLVESLGSPSQQCDTVASRSTSCLGSDRTSGRSSRAPRSGPMPRSPARRRITTIAGPPRSRLGVGGRVRPISTGTCCGNAGTHLSG
jgi:Domain of unknown function (DUF4272)